METNYHHSQQKTATTTNTPSQPDRFAIPYIPAHIIAQCDNIYPPSVRPTCPVLGAKFDEQRHHFCTRRFEIEKGYAAKKSAASAADNQNMPAPTQAVAQPPSATPFTSQTLPEQTPNEPHTIAEQSPNKTQTNTEQNPNRSQTTNNKSTPESDPDLAFIQEEIVERTQARSPLDNLPIAQQELLYDLLSRYSLRKVKEVISLPFPRGLNITPSLGALFEFKRRFAKRTQLQKKRDVGMIALELLNEPPIADDGYTQAAERLLRMRLLETINNPASKTSEIRDLYQTLTRLRAQAVSEKRLALAERKLNQS